MDNNGARNRRLPTRVRLMAVSQYRHKWRTRHVTGKANRDLVKIGHYTEQSRGRAQRKKYLKSIVTRFGWIAKNPLLGKTYNDIKTGYRSYQEGKHVVLYIIDGDAVHIIGVLHENMDYGRHL